MADNEEQSEGTRYSEEQEQEAGMERHIQVRDKCQHTGYSNFCTVSGARDAVMIAFGSMFGNTDRVDMEHKVAVPWTTAKRLAISLGQVIRQYESQFGEIEVEHSQLSSEESQRDAENVADK